MPLAPCGSGFPIGLYAFVKTTGEKGVHLVVPVARRHKWNEIKKFCKMAADSLVREAPERYTSTMSKTKRTRKIFIDYLRDATAVTAYSTRAKPGAPISTTLN